MKKKNFFSDKHFSSNFDIQQTINSRLILLKWYEFSSKFSELSEYFIKNTIALPCFM